MIALIMVVIGVVNDNNLWLYLALGFTVLSTTFSALKNYGQAQELQKTLNASLENLEKSMKSTFN